MTKNGFKRLIFVVMATCLGGCGCPLYSFSLKSLSPYTWTEAIHVKTLGGNEVSYYYQEKTNEFLRYLDGKDQGHVKVRRLEVSSQALQSNFAFSSFVGLALWTGIWLDEVKLEKVSEAERLWTIALVATQYKLNISLKNLILTQILPWGAGLANVACVMIGLPLIKRCGNTFSKSLMAAIVGLAGARISLSLYSSLVQQWYSRYKKWECEASLTAAKLLCENGYAQAFEKHMGLLAENGKENPLLLECRGQLSAYWDEWLANHPEYKTISVDATSKKE